MKNNFPITIVAQLNDVTVFQTAALQTVGSDTIGLETQAKTTEGMLQKGQTSYGELNLGLHVKDNALQVLDNRMHLLSTINAQLIEQQKLPIESLHWVNQVHGQHIHDIDATILSTRPISADAMTSQQTGLGLAIMTADCVPIVLYQPTTGQIAAIHAGWQGLACGVIKATVERFTMTGQIMAWIGVCISQPNYEVGSHVRDQLLSGCIDNRLLASASIDNFDQLFCGIVDNSVPFNADSLIDTHNDRLHNAVDKLSNIATVDAAKMKLNLPKLAATQLGFLGIKLCNKSPIDCSYASPNYYSYRRQTHLQQPATGRMALVIVRSAAPT